jgi:signal transduction histidine kinase
MDDINESYQGLKQIDLKAIEANVQRYEKRVATNLKELRERFPGESETLEQLVDSFSDMKLAFDRAKAAATTADQDRQRLMELAGVGLMVEVVAHELARATKHTLDVLRASQRRHDVPDTIRSIFDNLHAQLTTIERRLRVLDPLSVSGRQRRTEFDLVELVRSSFEGRADELKQLGVKWIIKRRSGGSGGIWVKAARGMLVQIVENLLSNSIYWLGRERASNSRFKPEIVVEIDEDHSGSFIFTDNGPGIAPQAAERVFDAFFSTRRGEGRGLGLYFSRENARHFGGDLVLLQERKIHPDRLNSFHFMLSTTN